MNNFIVALAIFFNSVDGGNHKNAIPFTLTPGNNISIQAVVNNRDTVQLMLHTAASDMTLREEVVKTMKSMHFGGTADSVKSWGGQANVSRVSNNNEVAIGFIRKNNITIAENVNSGPGTDGKFGLDFFAGKIVEIDFDKSLLFVHDVLPKQIKNYQKFKLVNDHDMLFLEAVCDIDANTKLPNKFLIHSGYAGSILLDDQFVADNRLSEKIQLTGGQDLKDSFGNIVKTKTGVLPALTIGNMELNNIPVGFFEGAIGRQKMSIIGMGVLKRFNFIVDANRDFIYVKANDLTDPKYFNLKTPGLTPEVFAPGIISLKDQFEFGSIYSKDRNELYIGVKVNGRAETRMLKYENGKWSAPVPILIHDTYSHNDPALTPDEKTLFFISDRPANGTGDKKDYDIWYVERQGNKWSEPKNAGPAINTNENQYYISFTKEGKMYFSSNLKSNGKDNYDIHSSVWKDGAFQVSQKLGPAVNTPRYEGDVYAAPDESYLIYCANHEGDLGQGDLYVVFKQKDGSWSEAKSLGNTINTETTDFCPFVTPDGKFLMYSSRDDIYWVSMEAVMKLK